MSADPTGLRPATEDYIAQALRNYQFFQDLYRGGSKDGFRLDWAVTALFYSAVHLVNAHSEEFGQGMFIDHSDRMSYVFRCLRPIGRSYSDLCDFSRDTRYRLVQPQAAEVKSYHDREFKHIVTFLEKKGIPLGVDSSC